MNFESKIAEGTLLITWHESIDTIRVSFWSRDDKSAFTASILAKLPANIKKKIVKLRKDRES